MKQTVIPTIPEIIPEVTTTTVNTTITTTTTKPKRVAKRPSLPAPAPAIIVEKKKEIVYPDSDDEDQYTHVIRNGSIVRVHLSELEDDEKLSDEEENDNESSIQWTPGMERWLQNGGKGYQSEPSDVEKKIMMDQEKIAKMNEEQLAEYILNLHKK